MTIALETADGEMAEEMTSGASDRLMILIALETFEIRSPVSVGKKTTIVVEDIRAPGLSHPIEVVGETMVMA